MDERHRAVRAAEKDFITLEDGYVCLWGDGGAWSESDLRAIADEMACRNAAWDQKVKQILGEVT